MPFTRPGVYVSESPLISNVRTSIGTTAVAFVGTAPRGPVDVPTLIANWSDFRTIFGDVSDDHELGYAVYHFFANGGATCWVKRVISATSTASTAASIGVSANIDNDEPLEALFTLSSRLLGTQGNGITAILSNGDVAPVQATVAVTGEPTGADTVTLFTLKYKEPGTVGNNKTVAITTTTPGAADAFPVFSLVLGGGVTETVTNLTLDPGDPNYIGNIGTLSQYVEIGTVTTGLVPASNFDIGAGPFTFSGGTVVADPETATFDMGVYWNGSLVETWDELSLVDGSLNFVGTVLNNSVTGSRYVSVTNVVSDTEIVRTNFSYGFGTGTTFALAGGVDNAAVSASAFFKASVSSTVINLFKLSTRNPGSWGNGVSVNLTSGQVPASATKLPTFSLSVSVGGLEVERWSELSVDPDSSRYIETILSNYSTYLTVSDIATVTPSVDVVLTTGATSFLGGADGASVVDSDYVAALPALDHIDTDVVINLPGVYAPVVVNGALSYAQGRGNGFVIIDPSPSVTSASDVLAITNGYTSALGWGAVYYPSVTMYDPAKTGPGALRTTAPGGAIAGAYVRSERQRSVAKAPAGYGLDLRNVFALKSQFTEAEVGTLYSANVNTLRTVPGAGAYINGARTLERTAPDMYIPIRRSLNFLKARLKEITAFAVFEPNDSRLWDSIKIRVGKELTDFWARGGLKGNDPDQAFYILCDSSNNTPATIAEGEVHVEVGLALQYPAEFIVVTVSQWTGGANTAESA
jgi:uncharacterized protein